MNVDFVAKAVGVRPRGAGAVEMDFPLVGTDSRTVKPGT